MDGHFPKYCTKSVFGLSSILSSLLLLFLPSSTATAETTPSGGKGDVMMRPTSLLEMQEVEESLEKCRRSLVSAGPPGNDSAHRRLLLTQTLTRNLPSFVERLCCCTPMRSAAEVRRTVQFFAMTQDFIDVCLRSPLLSEGPLMMDLSPLLYVLRLIMSVDPVAAPRYSAGFAGAAKGGGCYCFNRDHGHPLVRVFDGHVKYSWPDDEPASR